MDRIKNKEILKDVWYSPIASIRFLKCLKHDYKDYMPCNQLGYYLGRVDSDITKLLKRNTKKEYKLLVRKLNDILRCGYVNFDDFLSLRLTLYVIYKLRKKYALIYLFL
jgi:hypothetical protein